MVRDVLPAPATLASREDLVYFPISDDALRVFQREHPQPNDYVVNALQLAGVITVETAKVLRRARG
jgi:hypothetical protein